ncbi:MAG: hypothetical protein EOP63_01950 [Sphingomonadales bacterium]|nr:MAG: hypothetical protein EOP63_01950 [Sphingomonadales bacterium]
MIALGLFRTVRCDVAIWLVLIGGWLFLPPGNYHGVGDPAVLPYWIIGGALPSDVWLAKAWTAPALAASCSILFDQERWSKLRFNLTDVPIMLFCLWPVPQSLLVETASPFGFASAAYLSAVWGLPWIIARLYLRDMDDAQRLAAAFALLSLALLPLAVAEGISSGRLHAALLGAHPFAYDGIGRYMGFRPQALFEHGNQYGIWCAGATLAAFWLLLEGRDSKRARGAWLAVAALLLGMTLASQSVGAIVILFAGGTMLAAPCAFALARMLFPAAIAAILLVGALHVSGIVPLRTVAEKTVAGQTARDMFRAVGRQSLPWRIGQDLKTLPLIQKKPLLGSARWDWFEPAHSRPWGLPLLLLGQFGLIGLACLTAALAASFFRHLVHAAKGPGPARLYVCLLLLFACDALLNSFLLYPAILAAGAAATGRGRARIPQSGAGERSDRTPAM